MRSSRENAWAFATSSSAMWGIVVGLSIMTVNTVNSDSVFDGLICLVTNEKQAVWVCLTDIGNGQALADRRTPGPGE